MGLLAEVVVDDLAPAAAAREVEVDRAVETARAHERGVEVLGAVGGPDHQDVRRLGARRVELPVCRDPTVDPVDGPVAQALAAGRRVERLELDEQLVHHARDALAPGRRPHAGARRPDGVDLLDEPDGAALLAGRLAQRLEVGADLAVGLPVVHRLEGRRRHEQEGHAGLASHGLGHVGLPGAGRSLEEDGAAGRATHALTEGLEGEEQVERLHHLLDDHARAFDVGERHVDLTRAVEDVGRAARAEHRHEDGAAEEEHQQEGGDVALQAGRDVRRAQDHGAPQQGAEQQPGGDDSETGRDPAEAQVPVPLALHRHVGHRAAQRPDLSEYLTVHRSYSPWFSLRFPCGLRKSTESLPPATGASCHPPWY